MPVLNCVNYIREAIESVLNQTLYEIELIIIDAGSVDGTLEIIQTYMNDNRLILLHSDKKSVGYQSNIGLKQAKGDYVGFIEDDYVDKVMYEKLYLDAYENNLDWIKCEFNMFMDSTKGRYFLKVEPIRNKSIRNAVINPKEHPEILRWDANHWKGIYKTSFLRENSIWFNESKGAAFQDTGFIQQVFILSERGKYIDGAYYNYRRDNYAGSTYSSNGLKFFYNEFNYILNKISGNDAASPFMRDIYLRASMMFFSQAQKIPVSDYLEDEIIDSAEKLCQLLENAERNGLIRSKDFTHEQWINYKIATVDAKVFLNYYSLKYYFEWNEYKELCFSLKRSNAVIMCGYGIEAKKWEFFLLCNGVNLIAIADKNEEKQNTITCNGINIFSYEVIKNSNNDITFFIPSLKQDTRKAIIAKLEELQIDKRKIVTTDLWLHPYQATTIIEGEIN